MSTQLTIVINKTVIQFVKMSVFLSSYIILPTRIDLCIIDGTPLILEYLTRWRTVMSRVRGDVAIQNNSYKKKNGTNFHLSELMIFDVWILYKVREIFKAVYRKLCPLLRTIYLMGIGAGILFVYMSLNENLQLSTCEEKLLCQDSRQPATNLLGISDRSKLDTAILKEEILKLKFKTWSLDTTIRKMSEELSGVQSLAKTKQMPDFVSEAVGGSVVSTPDTVSFFEPEGTQLTLFGIPIWRPNYFTPRKVIQSWTQPGECWAFHGSHGKIILELALPATISHVTMEHIPVTMSLTGKIDSAPKEFAIFGQFKDEFVMIGTFEYNIHGPWLQTFFITKQEMLDVPLKRIMLEILSNWGNEKYTCIYRFRVHGKAYNLNIEN